MRSAGCLLALVLYARVALAEEAAPDAPAAKARASALVNEASRAYQRRDYPAALAGFEEAYAVYASPRLLFNLGQTYAQLGRYVEATTSFERFLTSAADAPASAQAEARRALEAMREKVARIEVASNVAGAEVLLDGRSQGLTPQPRPVLVTPGRHQVVVRKAGAEPFARELEVLGGTLARVEAELQLAAPPPPPPAAAAAPAPAPPPSQPALVDSAPAAPPPSPGSPTARKVGVGLVIAAPVLMATGIYLGVKARQQEHDIEDRCNQSGCAGPDIVGDDRLGRRLDTAQWILLGTGAATLITGAAIYLVNGPDSEWTTRVSLGVDPRGAALARLAGRF